MTDGPLDENEDWRGRHNAPLRIAPPTRWMPLPEPPDAPA